jgi:hypothetical protein
MSITDILALLLIVGIFALMPVGAFLVYLGFTSALWPGVGEAILGILLFLIGLIVCIAMVVGD